MFFKCFIIPRSEDWNWNCSLSLFWRQLCIEKLYEKLIMCIINICFGLKLNLIELKESSLVSLYESTLVSAVKVSGSDSMNVHFGSTSEIKKTIISLEGLLSYILLKGLHFISKGLGFWCISVLSCQYYLTYASTLNPLPPPPQCKGVKIYFRPLHKLIFMVHSWRLICLIAVNFN